MRQKTIKRAASCTGIGIHTGEISSLEFRPAEEGAGIYFLHNGKKIGALAENIVSTNRGSVLASISTVEHALAAVSGLGIDNVEIYLDGPEPPALDGSAKGFAELLQNAGIVEQNAESNMILVPAPIKVNSGDSFVEIVPDDHLSIEAFIDYSHTIAGTMTANYDERTDVFEREVAPARTFGLLEEVEALKDAGLAKGASIDNAIAITKTGYSSPLRFDNELARHKIVDIIGDMALAGKRIRGKILSHKGGHKLNVELVRRITNASS